MMRFEWIDQSGATAVVTAPGDINLSDAVEHFERFLRACGYVVDMGTIEIIEKEPQS